MDDFQFPTQATTTPSPTASDTDEFNTSSARLHFGPLKSPERRFIPDLNTRTTLFPHAQSPPLRRSPRLSSPRLRSQSPQPSNDPDVEEVEQLVQLGDGEEEEEDDDDDSSCFGTPEKNPFLEDEPSSALADRVLRAHDNPSPPPSPSRGPTLEEFDPLHDDIPESSCTFPGTIDLIVLDTNHQPGAPLTGVAHTPQVTPTRSIPIQEDLTASNTSQQDLISFDLPSTPTSGPKPASISHADAISSAMPPIRNPSVDELLSRSPSPSRHDAPVSATSAPLIIVDVISDEINDSTVRAGALVSGNDGQQVGPSRSLDLVDNSNDCESNGGSSRVADLDQTIALTPLRRSTRPRRSVSPNPPMIPSPNIDTTANILDPSSSARTQRKKKPQPTSFEEEAPDSCDETIANENVTNTKEISTPLLVASSERVRGKERSPGKTPQTFHRELGSLSPTSTDLLSRLVPSLSKTGDMETQYMPSFSIFPPPSPTLPSATPARSSFLRSASPVRSTNPMRSTSPTRSTTPARSNSPSGSKETPRVSSKQLKANLPDGTFTTPARRIPLEQAVAQGHISPQKAAQLGNANNFTGPRFGVPRTPVFTIPGVDSPARRIVVADVSATSAQKRQQSIRSGSPIRATSKEHVQSVESQPLSKDRELDNAGSSSLTRKQSKLPFPLVAAAKMDETTKDSRLTASTSSPMKSSLKQPTSRIPRIGTKPYARPTGGSLANEKLKTTVTMRTVDLGKAGEASTSNLAPKSSRLINESVPKATTNDTVRVNANSTVRSKAVEAPPVFNLKRKRGLEKASPLGKSRPAVMIRQVPQVVITKPVPSSSTRQPVPTVFPAASQSKKTNGILRIRRVVDREPAVQSSKVPSKQDSELPPSVETSNEEGSKADHSDKLATVTQPEAILEPGSPMMQDPLSTSPQSSQDPPNKNALSVAAVSDEPPQGVRRTTRVRKPVQPTSITDVFSEGSTRPLQRRKVNTQPIIRSDDAFSGMSATALKALTTSNTTRNQAYVAAMLETEVIRKEGARPESPVVKVRTISQRQQDDKGKQRKERAERRARRNENDSPHQSDGEDGGYSSLLEGEFDSYRREGDSSPLRRHRRGPGDDEDYETPDRPEKKVRVADNEDTRAERRVKWDRGLYTTVYLDEVKLGARQPPEENRMMKGCLAPTAKAVQLDTLGNLPRAESPLTELVQENIVVKKFVYDNDEPPQEIIVVKNTRSKAKKSKS